MELEEQKEEIASILARAKAREERKGKLSRDRAFVGRSMFQEGFTERRDLEQYFWTDKTISAIKAALQSTFDSDNSCCLCTPTVAHSWWVEDGEGVSLLDLDTRFKYLPKFRYFDLRFPEQTDLDPESTTWRVIVFDPPFFYIPMQTLYEAVLYVCKGNIKQTKLLVGFLRREEKTLLETFKEFNLKRTSFPLEYAHVKSNKWANYAMYSNVDLPGIKRISGKN
ncbi:unnamed protein product [Allacma fusca]|uniref:N6-adenine methyltransferase n=1 Tax=Allacma fusca TaxID=39272 RepID=A0A8J2PUW2_9HEXA|nr:unnamed protein product [Allacma fusca]